ncbi:bifunctional 2-polyprenyl-6-hydroxyphenol methylase/3-demethylubiquinol 3-O-methyltransferase UbiG [Streptomyces sp. 7-21]|uniref:class I SAM-dependent methyltransferase n=1 Tax=Streptomyces sp. 7-21 TaxID=2802283 RepID=UPI00191D274E|nr:class I SAM-dependent methyltransferase [Streptomyces sp. 7-21]MBL1065961.1 class I SAM-dependent methyltransferase [Streptomyces sp. 7-21]
MPFDHNDHYHRLLLRQLPPGCRTALDVGCGTGRFAGTLAARGIEVDALDPDAWVIEAARRAHPGPRYRCEDVTAARLPAGRYDFISCLASLHHVPFATVTALRAALAPGGVLAVLGCYREATLADRAWSLAAVPANTAARVAVSAADRVRGVAAPPRPPVAEPGMTLAEIRAESARLLPGSRLRRLLFWRYLLVYRAPHGG